MLSLALLPDEHYQRVSNTNCVSLHLLLEVELSEVCRLNPFAFNFAEVSRKFGPSHAGRYQLKAFLDF